jgi:dienelactone hydrolase
MSNDARRRAELWSFLGKMPEQRIPSGRKVGERHEDGALIEEWLLDLNGIEEVPAVLVLPDSIGDNAPAVVYCHAHSDVWNTGKSELFDGIPGVLEPYAPDLVAAGVVTLAIDSWCFGDRQRNSDGKLGEQEAFCEMLWRGQVLFGMMMFDLRQALTWLSAHDRVDSERIGVLGMSMGATHAWWLSALDERIKLCVDICCLTDYDALIEDRTVGLHGVYYFVPDLLNHFSSAEINALIAPRARLSVNGVDDPWTPNRGVLRIAEELRVVYDGMDASESLDVRCYECGHEETPEMRQLVMRWISEKLVT